MLPEAARHFLELLGSCQSPGLCFFLHCSGTKAPSLRRRYPASSVIRASPPPHPALPSRAASRLDPPSTVRDFPCCHRTLPANMLSSIPRWTRILLVSLASYPMAAFPMTELGRRPH